LRQKSVLTPVVMARCVVDDEQPSATKVSLYSSWGPFCQQKGCDPLWSYESPSSRSSPRRRGTWVHLRDRRNHAVEIKQMDTSGRHIRLSCTHPGIADRERDFGRLGELESGYHVSRLLDFDLRDGDSFSQLARPSTRTLRLSTHIKWGDTSPLAFVWGRSRSGVVRICPVKQA
jgi:hypothetical protein